MRFIFYDYKLHGPFSLRIFCDGWAKFGGSVVHLRILIWNAGRGHKMYLVGNVNAVDRSEIPNHTSFSKTQYGRIRTAPGGDRATAMESQTPEFAKGKQVNLWVDRVSNSFDFDWDNYRLDKIKYSVGSNKREVLAWSLSHH